MSQNTFANVQTIKQAIANHNAGRTTISTFHFAAKFWTTDIDLGDEAQAVVQSMDALEARMFAEHGWSRKDTAFMDRLLKL
jgi:flagellar biosynthesis regulator FlaF